MEETIKTEQRESVKLMKMSKGYQWEIKIFAKNNLENENPRIILRDIERLDELNKKMIEKWEQEKNENIA
jgi:hypothetical protein